MTTSVKLHRAYKFRLYPSGEQEEVLVGWERQLRWLYNLAHEQRLMALDRPREERPRVDYFRQSREMTVIVRIDERLRGVVCCARQEMLRDLDKAWQRWRKRLGGRPRFKRRVDSVRIYLSTPKHWKVELGSLSLAGMAAAVGPIKLRQDRPWPGDAKFSSCHIVRDVNEWYAVFPLEFSAHPTKPTGGAVGINRGAVHALADSTGREVDSPHYYERALSRVKLLSKRLARKLTAAKALGIKPGKNADKARVKLARKHQSVRRQREWFLHEQSAHYANTYKLIGIEDLSTRQIVADPKLEELHHFSVRCKRRGCGEKVVRRRLCQKHYDEQRFIPMRAVHRSILDVGWYELGRQLDYKSQATGARVVRVNPGLGDDVQAAGISSTCSGCDAALDKSASGNQRSYCDRCWASAPGDTNAARNVMMRALRATKPPAPKSPKATIKIKGRARAQTETTAKPAVDASGRDPPVRGPDERGKPGREVGLPERTVLPKRTKRRNRDEPPTHARRETTD